MNKYKVGTMLVLRDTGRKGVVVSANKLPKNKIVCKDDICVEWEPTNEDRGFVSTYDGWCLDENCDILGV